MLKHWLFHIIKLQNLTYNKISFEVLILNNLGIRYLLDFKELRG
jgi:hypothetical protein